MWNKKTISPKLLLVLSAAIFLSIILIDPVPTILVGIVFVLGVILSVISILKFFDSFL